MGGVGHERSVGLSFVDGYPSPVKLYQNATPPATKPCQTACVQGQKRIGVILMKYWFKYYAHNLPRDIKICYLNAKILAIKFYAWLIYGVWITE